VISDIFPVKSGVGKSIMVCFSISSIFVSDRQPFNQFAALNASRMLLRVSIGRNFRFGSQPDMTAPIYNVRFTPESGHPT
jgi:hypothetical protein